MDFNTQNTSQRVKSVGRVGDMIDRQALIKNYQRVCREIACDDCPFLIRVTDALTDCRLERFLQNIPSAQPEYTEQDMRNEFSAGYDCGMEAAQHKIVRCKDCKHWEYDVIFADGWCRVKLQANPEWYCTDAERRTDE